MSEPDLDRSGQSGHAESPLCPSSGVSAFALASFFILTERRGERSGLVRSLSEETGARA